MKKIAIGFIGLFCLFFAGYTQQNKALGIGDAPPPLQYSKWLKGEPVASFSGDQLYILEFWATWCGPCKAAMPHLTKLQKDYQGKATFIGVDVWEKVPEGKSYESSLPDVEKFVKGNAANMGYSVIADNNEQFMVNNWLNPAGIRGIPATFIIKDNRIIWMGHPISLDTTLPKILDGSYDMQAFKVAYEKKTAASGKQEAAMMAAMQPVQDALKAKEYQKAFDLMEKAKADQPILKISLDNMKFTTLLKNISQEQAMAFAKDWAVTFKSAPVYVMGAVANEKGLEKSTYLAAARMYEEAKPEGNPVALHLLASCYAQGGDYKNAAASEEKAVRDAKTALKEGKMIGTIMDYTVVEYEEALAKYRKEVR
jgi:thiol-disulfide isomerase/thioredoxin